jgi:hypothetical protein
LALHATGRFPNRLHRRQQERDQDRNDRQYHQQFDHRKGSPRSAPWQEAMPLRNIHHESSTRDLHQSKIDFGSSR